MCTSLGFFLQQLSLDLISYSDGACRELSKISMSSVSNIKASLLKTHAVKYIYEIRANDCFYVEKTSFEGALYPPKTQVKEIYFK